MMWEKDMVKHTDPMLMHKQTASNVGELGTSSHGKRQSRVFDKV
jgi:hypothetical protein